MWDKAKDFIQRAFTVIFVATIIIWFLQTFDTRLNVVADSSNSLLALVGRWIAPVLHRLGSLTGSFYRTHHRIYCKRSGSQHIECPHRNCNIEPECRIKRYVFRCVCCELLVFTLLYTPCVAAIAAVKREMGSGLKAALVVVLQCLVAWVVALLVYQVGGLLL